MATENPDKFDYAVRKALAERAGYVCSYPGCDVPTIGPSEENSEKSNKTGMACHIAAASSGKPSRRYISTMTAEERRSIDNGIWMCYTHGKLIDGDEVTFTIPVLKKWRELAEYRAKFRQQYGASTAHREIDFFNFGLAQVAEKITDLATLEKRIGDAITFSCVPQVWGKEVAKAISDLCIEVALNAFRHGGATDFDLSIQPEQIVLTDNGREFDLWDLPRSPAPRGGTLALKAMQKHMTERVILATRRDADVNKITIAKIDDVIEIEDYTPCVISVTSHEIREATYQIVAPNECKMVYVILPEYASPSLPIQMERTIKEQSHDPSRLIFVMRGASNETTRLVSEAFPESQIVHMS
jgi:hypothetical protein